MRLLLLYSIAFVCVCGTLGARRRLNGPIRRRKPVERFGPLPLAQERLGRPREQRQPSPDWRPYQDQSVAEPIRPAIQTQYEPVRGVDQAEPGPVAPEPVRRQEIVAPVSVRRQDIVAPGLVRRQDIVAPEPVRRQDIVAPVSVRRQDLVPSSQTDRADFAPSERYRPSELSADPRQDQYSLDIPEKTEKDRLEFQVHGQQGPHSYKFGYDTGSGYNRQFRFEERDSEGNLKGRYGFYDDSGKLQVVNYSATHEGGFHADGDFGTFPVKEHR